MFKTVPQCSFLEYKESFQSQLKKRKTSLTKYPFTSTIAEVRRLGGRKSDDSIGKATEKMVANEWQKPGYRLNPQHQLLCQHCKTNLIFLGSFFYIRLDDRVTKSAQRPEQPCCPSVKPSTRCILCGPSPIATGHGSVIGPSENRSQLTGLAASTL